MDWQALYQRLASESTELRELDDHRFLELKAILPPKPVLDLTRFRFDRAGIARERREHEWLKSLLRFNEMARQKTPPVTAPVEVQPNPSALPRNQEEAQQLGYVALRDVLGAMESRFQNYGGVNRYLERHTNIRTYKPGGSRKMVHAGDLIRQLASEADSESEGINPEGAKQRAESLRKNRQVGRK